MPRRRLLTIAHSYAVAMNRRLAHELARASGGEWEVTVVAPDYFHGGSDLRPVRFEAIEDEPVRVEVVPARMTRFVHLFTYGPRLKELLAQDWDLIHAWEEPFIFAGRQIARAARPGTPLVFATFQNILKHYPPPFNWIERRCMNRAAGWIAFGNTAAQALSDRPGYRDRPMCIIPPGVDVERFRSDPQARVEQRRLLGWDESGPEVIGFLGRFTEEKGVRIAMRSIERVNSPWRALFVGAGPMERQLRAWAGRFGERVRICTDVSHDQVPAFLNAMDLLIAPSQTKRNWREQFGRMLIEAFACGLPVLGSDSGEIPFVIGDAGVILPESDASAWAAALESVIENPTRRAELGARGRERACDRFSWPRVAKEHLEFFERILDRAPATRSHSPVRSPPRPIASVTGRPRKLLSIGHSYVVALNRRLAHEMNRESLGQWEITAVAPNYFHGTQDLRPLRFEPMVDEPTRVEVVPAHLSRFVHIFSYGRELQELLREGWDFVHAWEEPYIWAGGQIARWTPNGVPLVYRTAQSLEKWYPPPFNWIERRCMERAAGWICSGSLVARTLAKREIYAHRPMRLIPLGVDTEVFAPNRAAGDEILRKLNWERIGAPIVGYLGRFTRPKGLRLLMDVLENLDTPWRALFVGAGPMENELRAWAGRFADRVRVCTDVRHGDVPAYLNAMDLLAAPSQTTPGWREQFGRMLIEAFATGVPVIGSDSGEIPHVIRDTGVIVPERDEAGWTSALCRLLTTPEERHTLAVAARVRAQQEFAWPIIAQRYLEFFEEIAQGPDFSAVASVNLMNASLPSM